MYNKIKSFNLRGKRSPGRPFNTTTYPWRSTAIGRSFILNQKNQSPMMRWKLQQEGIFFDAIRLTANSWLFTRVK
jgi:hypothetical protein